MQSKFSHALLKCGSYSSLVLSVLMIIHALAALYVVGHPSLRNVWFLILGALAFSFLITSLIQCHTMWKQLFVSLLNIVKHAAGPQQRPGYAKVEELENLTDRLRQLQFAFYDTTEEKEEDRLNYHKRRGMTAPELRMPSSYAQLYGEYCAMVEYLRMCGSPSFKQGMPSLEYLRCRTWCSELEKRLKRATTLTKEQQQKLNIAVTTAFQLHDQVGIIYPQARTMDAYIRLKGALNALEKLMGYDIPPMALYPLAELVHQEIEKLLKIVQPPSAK